MPTIANGAPDRETVEARIKEYDDIGIEEFLRLYANGRGAKAHRVLFNGRLYDAKALWASARRPPIRPPSFNTKYARSGLRELGFQLIESEQES